MPNWTEGQRAAIDARNHSILVSAAAGSGKTAVLVERIVRLLREGATIDRMMIVTFTRAAASEMRQRLSQRLLTEVQNDPALIPAIDALETADISTIHHFCQQILKSEFQAVDIDPLARVCEEQQRTLLFDQAFRDAMNELLDDESQKDFHQLSDSFSQNAIHDMAADLYRFLMSLPQPFAWLDDHVAHVADHPLDEHPWYQVIVQHSARMLRGIGVLLDQQRDMFDEADAVDALRATWEKDQTAYEKLMNMDLGTAQQMAEALKTFGFARAATCKGLTPEQEAWKKRFTQMRTQLKTQIKELGDALFLDETRTSRELSVIQTQLSGLTSLVKHLHAAFMAGKQKANVVDFNDLEQLTLRVMAQDALREKLQRQYDHIFVDECQDVSAVQDAIIQQIHGPDSILFMVGDVKQSIYRFRLADPTLFLGRMRTWSDDPEARERRIFLQQNFRSRAAVLDATNRVFRKLMQADVTELDYLPEDELIPGRATTDDPPVELHLVDPTDETAEEPLDPLEAQANVIIARMQSLLNEKTVDGDVSRNYTWRDMVILMPQVARSGAALAEVLQRHGIPVYFDGATSYFGLPEIRMMTSLLAVIDDPLQDVPLLAALKMPPFLMQDQELAEVRLALTGRDQPFHKALRVCAEQDSPLGKRCADILGQIGEWRFLSQVMRLTDFLWLLIRETGFYASVGALPEGGMRQANLRLLCQRAAEYEDVGGTTLDGFLRQMGEMASAGDTRSAKELGEGENLVRIMTMHKSKGLEFPIVFLAGLSGALHLRGGRDVQMNSKLGVCMPYVNREMNIRRATMGTEAFEIQRYLDEKAERARLLYVGMTRARDRLLMVGLYSEKAYRKWAMQESTYRIWEADSMMDWLMQVVHDEMPAAVGEALSTGSQQVANPWCIRFWAHPVQQAVENSQQISHMLTWVQQVASVPFGEKLGKKWQSIYDEKQLSPLKTSVSALIRQQQPQSRPSSDDEEETEDVKARPLEAVTPMLLSDLPARPAFMEEKAVSGAQRGTLTHHALALFDLSRMKEEDVQVGEIVQQLAELTARGLFTAEEKRYIDVERVAGFYRSAVGTRLRRAALVRREWSFNLRLTDAQDTLLQGVIDCAFLEEDAWVLVDYKTDRIEDEEAFVVKYAPQLAWYGRALTEITGKPVREAMLFSLSNGKAYAV